MSLDDTQIAEFMGEVRENLRQIEASLGRLRLHTDGLEDRILRLESNMRNSNGWRSYMRPAGIGAGAGGTIAVAIQLLLEHLLR